MRKLLQFALLLLVGSLFGIIEARPYPNGAVTPHPVPIGEGGIFVFGFSPDAVTRAPIMVVYMSVESSPGGDSCYLSYWPSTNLIYLVGPSNEPVQSVTPRSSGVAENSRCSVRGASSYATLGSDGELTVAVSLTFKAPFASGTRPLWSAVLDSTNNSGWVQLVDDVYCVRVCTLSNLVPVTQNLFPMSRNATFERLAFDVLDGNGASQISNILVLINDGLSSLNACNFTFDAQAAYGAGVLYLVDDTGASPSPPIATLFPGSSATASNSRCSIRGQDLSLSKNGSRLTLNVGITLQAAGVKNIYLLAQDTRGGNSGWADRGDWIASTAFSPTNILNPGCGNAAGCTGYSSTITVNNPASPLLSFGLSLQSTGVATLAYSQASADLWRRSTCSGVAEGEAPLPLDSISMGSFWSQQIRTTVPGIELSGITTNPQTPGWYFVRTSFRAAGTYQGTDISRNFTIQSKCVRYGDVPQIDDIYDSFSERYGAIERGSSGPNLKIIGSRLSLASSTTIASSAGISAWNISPGSAKPGEVVINFSVSNTAPTGSRQFTISAGSLISSPRQIEIIDSRPRISTVSPDRPWQPGETILVTLTGQGFGAQPTVSARTIWSSDQAPCLGSDQVSVLPGASDTFLQFSKTVPGSSLGCEFDIVLVSNGSSPTGFVPGPGGGGSSESASRRGSVLLNVSLLPIKIFIVHGLSDNPESMAPLAATLTATLAAPGRSDGGFVVEHRFAFDSVQGPPGSPSSCDPIEVAAQKLATYILFNSAPYQRIALIGHSLGGLVIRKMMTDRLLPVSMTDYFPRVVVGLATIGTPHLGYPYLSIAN